jgi:hypothetical protein
MVIPQSVSVIDSSINARDAMTHLRMSIEEGNKFICVRGDFILSLDGKRIVQYIGRSGSVIIPADIEILGPQCFTWCRLFSTVSFENGRRLKRIESNALSCSRLHTKNIPGDVSFIDGSALSNIDSDWFSVTIEAGNRWYVADDGFVKSFD